MIYMFYTARICVRPRGGCFRAGAEVGTAVLCGKVNKGESMRTLCGTILAAVAALSAHGAFDVRDFGAKGDGVAKDTAAIQHAIDAAHAAGGGCVVVPKGEWLTGALFFRPGVNLRLEKGAAVVGVDEADGYPMRETRIKGETCLYYPALINADRCDGFTISGEGGIRVRAHLPAEAFAFA